MPSQQVSQHVWWYPPGPPDRPSLCAVVGARWTLALDAGSSRAHTQDFLAGLPARPAAVAYTHSHWDHVFGGVEIGGPVIAHTLTAQRLAEMALRDWNDESNISDHIREELPAPRVVEVAPADIVFEERLEIDLGDARVTIEHVGGDHCDDACVMLVEPDALLFLGDCLCASPREDKLTFEKALPLYERVLAYPARIYVEGHHPALSTRVELEALIEKAQAASRGEVTAGDEDSEYFLAAFVH